MIFKRPKTSNNFSMYKHSKDPFLGYDTEEEKFEDVLSRKDAHCKYIWDEILKDPIYFWYLMLIFELYYNDEPLCLSYISGVQGYKRGIQKFDTALWNDEGLHIDNYDSGIDQGHYSMMVYRLSKLTGMFFAFDVRGIYINGYREDIAIKMVQSYFKEFNNSSNLNEDLLYELYCACGELSSIDFLRKDRSLIKAMHPFDYKENRRFSSDEENTKIYPFEKEESKIIGDKNEGGEIHISNKLWKGLGHKVSLLGEFISIDFESDNTNMDKLQNLIDTYVSKTFDSVYSIEEVVRKFINIAKKSEIIGNVVFIKFEDIVDADFPCFQFMYWLDNNEEGATIKCWNFRDAFVIELYDPTICHILGIGAESLVQKDSLSKISYNQKKEILELNGKKLSLGVNNEAFVKEYFDLMFDPDTGVSIDEIVERFEPSIDEFDSEKIPKTKKSLSYDRVNLLNKKIAKLTGITGLFKIANGYIKLTSEIRVEK